MSKDPIIAEIHAVRRQLWRESGGTSQKFAQYLRKHEAERDVRIISLDEWKRQAAARRKPRSERS